MHRHLRLLLFVACAAAALTVPAGAHFPAPGGPVQAVVQPDHGPSAAPMEDEEQLKQLERDRQAAFVRGDLERIERDTADDYTTINGSGALSDKPRMMASLRSGRTKVLSVTLDDLKARLYGDVAIVTGIYRDVSVTAGIGKRVVARFTRVFARRNGGWLAVAYQQTPVVE